MTSTLQASDVTAPGPSETAAEWPHAPAWFRRICTPALIGTLLVLVIGGVGLNARSIWLDESISAGLGRGSWDAWARGVAEDGGSQSLYFLLVRAFAFLGDDPWVIRLPALLGAALVPYPLWRLIAPRFSRAVALRAMLILAVSYSFITNAQEARAYTLLAAVLAWSWFSLDQAIHHGGARRWLLTGALAALSLYAQPLGAPILVAQAVWLLLHRKEVAWGHVSIGAGLAAILSGPLVYLMAFHAEDHTEWLGTFTVGRFAEMAAAAVGQQRISDALVLSALGGLLMAGLAGLGALPTRWATLSAARTGSDRDRSDREGSLLFVLWAAVPLAVLVAGSFSRAYFSARYAVPLVPATAVLASVGVDRVKALNLSLGRLAFGALLCVLGARTIVGYGGEQIPWAELEPYVAANATSDDMIAFEPAYVQAPFEYYAWHNGHAETMARPMPPSSGWSAPRHPNTEAYPATLVTPPAGDLWVVVRAEIGIDEVPPIVDRLGLSMVEVERVSFGDAVVLRFERE